MKKLASKTVTTVEKETFKTVLKNTVKDHAMEVVSRVAVDEAVTIIEEKINQYREPSESYEIA